MKKKSPPVAPAQKPRRLRMEEMTPEKLASMQETIELLRRQHENDLMLENVRLEEAEGRERSGPEDGSLKDVGMLNRLALQRYMEVELRKFHRLFEDLPNVAREHGALAAYWNVQTELVPALRLLDIAPNRTQEQTMMDHRIYANFDFASGMLDVMLRDDWAGFNARLRLLTTINEIIIQPALRWLASKSQETGAGLAPIA